MKIAVFIDFQGTIGGEGTDDIHSLTLYPFTAKAIRKLNAANLLVVGITNQSRISKGELTWKEYKSKLQSIESELSQSGARFDAVYCCPHMRADQCDCKKPLPGMVNNACKEFDIDLSRSYVIGDMGKNDMVLAKNIGEKGILVLTGVGRGSLAEFRHTWQDYEAYRVVENIEEAADFILDDIKQQGKDV